MKWGRILLAAVAVPVADLLVITLVVTAYAFKLAFQARGAPDQVRITHFAEQFGRSSWFVIAVILTVPAAAWVARTAHRTARRHGAVVGVIAGNINSTFLAGRPIRRRQKTSQALRRPEPSAVLNPRGRVDPAVNLTGETMRSGIRRALMRRLRYGVCFAVEDDVIVAPAVFHASRDPAERQRRSP